ncbi:MAG: glycosyltransferase [Anaerolineae bacterium]|nr:glycosyltransferase [Anaerolineae bacterium]
MKVVYISIFRPGVGGGEGRVAQDLARHLARQHEVALICPGERTELGTTGEGMQLLTVHSAGEGAVSVPLLSQGNVDHVVAFLDAFAPDIVHAHEPVSLALVGQIWARAHGVPFVYTSHVLPSRFLDFGTGDLFHAVRGQLSESVAAQFLTHFHEGCDAIVALNRFAAADIRSSGYEGRLLLIPNGSELDRFTECRFADPGAHRKALTFIGFVNARKNQLYLLKMMRHLPGTYDLLLVGKLLSTPYGRQLERFIHAHRLRNVAFTGQVPYEQIPGILEKTHVLVSASTMEVQSLVIIEALASGTPIVGLANETVDELVDGTVGERLESDTPPEAFARAVARVCALPAEDYVAMCDRARARAAPFSWANVVAMTVDAYDALQAARQPPLQTDEDRIADLLSMIPSGDVRQAIAERVIGLNRILHSIQSDARLDLLRWARRISPRTWWSAVMTLLFSAIAYLVVKSRPFAQKEAWRAAWRGAGRRGGGLARDEKETQGDVGPPSLGPQPD